MGNNQDKSSRSIIIMIACGGVLSSLAVFFSLYIFFQRSQGDTFFSSEAYLAFRESNAVRNIRHDISEEFLSSVVNCISPPILPDEILTEEQVNGRVLEVLKNYSASNENIKNLKCGVKNPHWTFALPCKLVIISSSYKLSAEVNLGNINLCVTTITTSIQSAVRSCAASAKFQACLVSSVLENDDIRKDMEKPVESQAIKSK